ncbi:MULTISPECIES: site-specific DNA-methyltransferase [Providencia]|uniref:site-specific DNA-methyltransferase n=1 Tax=Providencia TaxID=586 RepID=UPI00065E3500|nr:site-specific DNA-methyltransferase [Providencia rettgeri]UEK59217.1 site-specific DNA-methyltransferase [Providencia rettgeri]
MANEEQINIEKYEFEPIKGYPMLNWKGKRPFRSTQYFPAQLKEVYGKEDENGWINKIFWGDNLQVMSHLLKSYRSKIDLIYIDPPFDSKAVYNLRVKLRGTKLNNDTSSFEEKQYSDIWSNDDYLQFMYERLILMRELLSPTGSIILHCDWHKSAHLRCIMDEVFGESSFVNEIIWHYRKWTVKSQNFQRNHDNLLWYSMANTSERIFNIVEVQEQSEGTMKRWKGKKQKAVFDENGIRTASASDEDTEGAPLADVWNISIINPAARERTNYPTQKPEQLLERIIRHITNEGDLVFDCFMGSGTTQLVSAKNNRRFIGADINLGAIQITTKRLVADKVFFEVYNVNNYDIFRNPIEAKDLLIEALEIQKLENNAVYDGEKDGYKVKIMPVNRIATKEDLNELIANFPYKKFEERKATNPSKPVEEIMLICMGHEPGLGAILENECGYKLKVEVVDILRDKSDLTFKYDSEAIVKAKNGKLVIEAFYPRNLLQKLSQQKEDINEWREMVESIMIDWNYDGAVMEPVVIDIPDKNKFVTGEYEIPEGASNIKIKITDLLSESYEEVIAHG